MCHSGSTNNGDNTLQIGDFGPLSFFFAIPGNISQTFACRPALDNDFSGGSQTPSPRAKLFFNAHKIARDKHIYGFPDS